MKCLTELDAIVFLDGEASANAATAIEEHLTACAACRARHAHLQALTRAVRRDRRELRDDRFTQEVLGRLSLASPPRRPLRWRLALPLAAAAVTGLLAVIVIRPPADHGFVARGQRPASTAMVGFEVFAHPTAVVRGAGERLNDGASVPVGSSFGFVLHNRSGKARKVMLFGVDSASTVHWFYPAYLDPQTDPVSIDLPAQPSVRTLPDRITPEAPAAGELTVVGLFTSTPLAVTEIEQAIGEGGVARLTTLVDADAIQLTRVMLVSEDSP